MNLRDRLAKIPQNLRPLGSTQLLPAAETADWNTLIGSGAGINPEPQFGSISGFPSSGRQPVSKAGFVADFRNNTIGGASLSRQQIIGAFNEGADIQGLFNSLFMITDDDCAVETYPGYQSWGIDSCAFYSIPIRGLNWIKVSGHRSFCFQMILSSQAEPLMANPITFHQERWGTQTLTKVNGVGVDDSWTSINFGASDGGTQIDPATYGDTSIHCGSIGAKNLIVTAADNDINLLFEGLNVSGKTWAADPMTGSSGVTLADGDVANMQTARYYHLVRLRARVDKSVAASGTAAITAQYRGFAAGF